MGPAEIREIAMCAGPACVQHALARPDPQFLFCTCVYFLCDIRLPEVQSHSDNSHMNATGIRSARALAQAHLQCHAFV